jgi:hypothetical protein
LDGLSPPAGGGWDGLASFAISDVRLEDSGWMIISSRQSAPKAAPFPSEIPRKQSISAGAGAIAPQFREK